jgi:hypothetical protein
MNGTRKGKPMGTFDEDLFDKGLARRKATLGEPSMSRKAWMGRMTSRAAFRRR